MEKQEKQEKKLTLFDCASLFAESMSEKFPNGCTDGSAIFMVATNGKKLAYIMEGTDVVATQMISNFAVHEEEGRDIIGNGLMGAIDYLKKHTDASEEPISLLKLLNELEYYIQDDIGQLMEEGYKDRPGSAINELHKLLDGCIYWQRKLKGNGESDSDS